MLQYKCLYVIRYVYIFRIGLNQVFCTINGKNYTAEYLQSLLLEYLKRDTEQVLGEIIDEAVITVPAYFYSKEREATIQAAKNAGLKVKKIINEPMAAAIAYGLNNWRANAKILVYDLGGGTFDVTLVEMNANSNLTTIATTGNRFLGGSDWDLRLENIISNKVREETGVYIHEDEDLKATIKGLAEKCKKSLSSVPSTKISLSLPNYGNLTIEITRAEFESATIDLIDRTGVLCKTVLKDAGVKWSDITDVLLVGGSTRMPQVSSYITGMLGKPPIGHINPDSAVALGAAVQSIIPNPKYILSQSKKADVKPTKFNSIKIGEKQKLPTASIKQLQLNEVTTHPMGIIAVNADGTEYINELIIPANHQIPVCSAKKFKFFTSSYEDNELEIYVLQGNKKPLECVIPYKYVVTGIRHVSNSGTIMRIQYSYDQNGIIHVQARQENDNFDLPIRKDEVPQDMSKYGKPIDKQKIPNINLSVYLAVDVSGSMLGVPLDEAKKAMCNFIEQINDSSKIGIIAVSDRTEIVQKLTDDKKLCKISLQSIRCGQTGGGNRTHPFDVIKKEFSGLTGRKFAVILADGMWDKQEIAIQSAKNCHKDDIEIAAVGFGHVDKKFLKEVSSSEANAFLVKQQELFQTFGSIAQSLGSDKKSGLSSENSETDFWDIL